MTGVPLVLVFYWLPVLLWLVMIFILSSIPGRDFPVMPTETWHFWAHRFAHFSEYMILGALFARAGLVNRPNKSLMTLAVFIVMVFAAGLFDEWHQSFVPGRMSQMLDVYFDTLCGSFGALVYQTWIFRPLLSPKK